MTSISEKEYYQLNISISKALNMMEAPLKLKHARSIIITTHRTKESKSFWAIISTQPLMENRFTAWKFCHLLHKVLREGHHSAIKQSQSHKSMLKEMGKLWGHLQDGVGNCIQAYCKLLVTKLDFHDKNAFLPGSLSVPFVHIEKFAGDDINVYFQLGVEIFDYLEDIIAVQENVFRTVDTYRMSSMSPQGQCRLAPLITLIQDSNPLYDCCVRIMFKLHHNLPNDILAGHRDRFREMFAKLKLFYDKVRPLQYFSDLIQVPILPDSAPNFQSRVDFGNYIPPVVTVPEPEPEPPEPLIVDHLVDLSVSNENYTTTRESNAERLQETINNYEQKIRDKDIIVENLEYQLQNFKRVYSSMEERLQNEIIELKNEISQLNVELKFANEARSQVENAKHELEQQIENSMCLTQKTAELEEKGKMSEEKFIKLKTMYSEMREEHINLLRNNGETKKQLQQEKQLNEKLKAENEITKKELEELQLNSESYKSEQKRLLAEALEEKSAQMIMLEKECNNLREECNSYKAAASLKTSEMAKTLDDLKERTAELQKCKENSSELECKLNETKEMLSKKIEEFEKIVAELNKNLHEKDAIIEKIEKGHILALNNISTERKQLEEKLSDMKNALNSKQCAYEELTEKFAIAEEKLNEMRENTEKLEIKCSEAIREIKTAELGKIACEEKNKNMISCIFQSIFHTTRSIISLNFNESGQQRFERSFQILDKLKNLFEEFAESYRSFNDSDKENYDKFISDLLLICYHICMLREQCMLVYNTTTDIEKGQKIFDMLLSMAEPTELLFANIQSGENASTLIDNRLALMRKHLDDLESLLRGLTKQLDSNAELGDIIESELAEMEKAIAEAAEKFVELLSRTRSNDDGIKLEVNEKILDACTNLMECIKRLIKQSKILQDEIISSGRGRISAKEFYKRNSEWTEGLISASKSVAKGANFLVEAANKAIVIDSGKNFEIIVAAQEIAACTAQLVISSKVKAPKGSDKLQELTKASRMVSQATGAVVAIVKDSNQRLENYTDVDLTKLTTSQAKKMEMDIHVKVLELEQALQLERLKLCAFRRNLYQNSEI